MMNKKTNWITMIIGLVIVFRLSANVYRLWRAGETVEQAKTELEEAQKLNLELERKLAEVQSDDFLEREAREKLGYGKPGEVVIIMPDDQVEGDKLKVESEKEPNWKMWRKLYLGF